MIASDEDLHVIGNEDERPDRDSSRIADVDVDSRPPGGLAAHGEVTIVDMTVWTHWARQGGSKPPEGVDTAQSPQFIRSTT